MHLEEVRVDGDDPHVLVRFGSWDAKNKRYRPPKAASGRIEITAGAALRT